MAVSAPAVAVGVPGPRLVGVAMPPLPPTPTPAPPLPPSAAAEEAARAAAAAAAEGAEEPYTDWSAALAAAFDLGDEAKERPLPLVSSGLPAAEVGLVVRSHSDT